MNLNEASGQINQIRTDWADLILESPARRIHQMLAWQGYDASLARSTSTWESHRHIHDHGQFSFRLIDESLLQLVFGFEGSALGQATLAYVEGPFTRDLQSLRLREAREYLGALEEQEPDFPGGKPTILRIDYDPRAERIVEHAACHLHLEPFMGARLPVKRVPTPRQFFEFCLRASLPTIYHERRVPEIPDRFMQGINSLDSGVLADSDGLLALDVPAAGEGNRVPAES